jgi:hypothetical protein
MHRVITALALALCVLGLQGSKPQPPSGEPVQLLTGIDRCRGGNPIEGDLRPDAEYGTAFWKVFVSVPSRYPVIWPTGFTGLRLLGGGVAVLDEGGNVVATTEREYRLVVVSWDLLRGKTRRLAEAIGAFAACDVETQ